MGAILSVLGGWWSRFFCRPVRAKVAVALPPPPASLEEAMAVVEAASRPPWAMPAPVDHTQSLIETVGAGAVAASAPVMGTAEREHIRARTLAALADLRQIPALQSLAQGFLRALNQPDVAFDELVATIEKDSALCVRVLRMANSVLVSPEQRIEDLESAVHMLGVQRVRQTAQALFTLRDAHHVAEGFDWRHLWMHALATASIASELERGLRGGDVAQLHLAALLHDVGKIVLSTVAPEDYRAVLVTAWHENGRLEDLERERFGIDHREAGTLFARAAGLPAIVLQTIAHHDRPEESEGFAYEVALVAIANYLSKAHGLGFSGARLDASDGEFEALPAWDVVAAALGHRPEVAPLERELAAFLPQVRAELRELRELG